MSAEAPTFTVPSFAPKGVGGWLLLFACSITLASPAMLLRSCYVFFHTSQAFHRPAVISVFEMASWLEMLVAASFVLAGFLVLFQKRQAKIMVPLVLALGGIAGVTIWSMHWLLPSNAPIREAWRVKMMFPMVQRVLYAGFWTWYWMSSERVSNTFEPAD